MHHFWLITNLTPGNCDGEQLLAMDRQRGKAEAHMGELMDVLNPPLSASPRPWHYADTFQPALPEAGVYRNNDTLFLLHLLKKNGDTQSARGKRRLLGCSADRAAERP